MTASALFFTILGVSVTVANLMKLVLWLDKPRRTRRHTHRRVAPVRRIADFPVAELDLERARYAA